MTFLTKGNKELKVYFFVLLAFFDLKKPSEINPKAFYKIEFCNNYLYRSLNKFII